jgi:hypothetical protein
MKSFWHDVLRKEGPVMPLSKASAWHIDLLDGGSEEDNLLYLRFYSDEETRQQWAQDWSGDILPASETPPYGRDPHLPASRLNGGFTFTPPDIAKRALVIIPKRPLVIGFSHKRQRPTSVDKGV